MSSPIEYMRKWRKEHPKYCIDCGREISHSSSVRCMHCSHVHAWSIGHHRKEHFHKGNKSHMWKGGRSVQACGYVLIYNPSHLRAQCKGYVLEHIMIWEKSHNKSLPKGWIIHHLNGIKSDNRSINLVALPNKKHYLVLQAKAKRIQELESLLNHQGQLL